MKRQIANKKGSTPPLASGKKFGAALLQTRVVCSLSQKGGWTPPADPPDNIFVAAGGVYPPFCEELQTLWFAAVLHQIFFLASQSSPARETRRTRGRPELAATWHSPRATSRGMTPWARATGLLPSKLHLVIFIHGNIAQLINRIILC
jgi:hypothetical protein